jgi:hypothetical protein
LLSFPPGTEMFQFPGFAPGGYGFTAGSFGHPGINARLTTPPGLSQSSTPFIASWRQGIPHTPLVAWPHRSHLRHTPPEGDVREGGGRQLRARSLVRGSGRVTILASLRLAEMSQQDTTGHGPPPKGEPVPQFL